MAKQKILIIEDEDDIVELLTFNLSKEGYAVESARTGEDGLAAARAFLPDVVLLDLMLPGLDGLDVCKALKNDDKTRNTLVIMLTAKSEETDIVTGLEVGADDYIAKPFSPRVLVARIRAAVRRSKSAGNIDTTAIIRADGLTIDPARHEVQVDGERLTLTPTEFQILLTLARRPGLVFSRYQIVNHVRGEDTIITDRAIDVQIAGLRKKLGNYGPYVETVRGAGYRFREV